MSANVTFNGPEIPPSSWPLEGVPGTLLDVIVDYVAQQARQDHVHAFEPTCRFERLYEKSEDRNVVAFTSNVKALSMVDRFFRHNVMSRKIFHTLEVGPHDDMIDLPKKVQRRSLHAVSLMWQQKGGAAWQETLKASTLQRNKLFLACPNVEQVVDLSGYLAYAKHHYPNSLTRIQLLLVGKGHDDPIDAESLPGSFVETSVLDASGLRILQINIVDDSLVRYGSSQSVSFGLVIAKLLQGCKELDILGLQLPGLPVDWYPGGLLPESLQLPDPLAGTLVRVGTLDLEFPYCTIGLGSEKRPLWWGYLGWIGHTPFEYTRLHILLIWSPHLDLGVSEFGHDHPTTQEILAMMGLAKLSHRESGSKTYVPPDDCISDEFSNLFGPLLLARPELEEIEVAWFVELPTAPNRTIQPDLYRLVIVRREDAAGYGESRAAYYEHILDEVVDKIIKEFCSSPRGSPTPVAANFDPATMPSGLPPHLASPVATVTDNAMASVDPAVGPVTQPSEAECEELD